MISDWSFSPGTMAVFVLLIVPILPFSLWYIGRLLKYVEPKRRNAIRAALRFQTVTMASVSIAACVVAGAAAFGYPGNPRASWVVMVTFHLVWWPFVMPLILRAHRMVTEESVGDDTGVRRASLVPRRFNDYLPAYWQVVAFGTALFGTLGVSSWIAIHDDIDPRMMGMAVVFALIGMGEWALFLHLMRKEVTHAPEYAGLSADSAEALRAFRVRGFFWMLLAVSICFFGFAIGCVEVGRGSFPEVNLGIAGGVVGTIVGMLGAGFGTACSLKAARLRATEGEPS
jgi:hypothetical protein